MKRDGWRRLVIPIGVPLCLALFAGAWYGVHLLDPGPPARAATLPTSVRYRTLPGHTETRYKTRRIRIVKHVHGKRVVTYRTVTRPVSVFVPPTTVAVTGPSSTTTRTVDGTIFRTTTTTLPGTTIIRTLPGTTITQTLPGTTVTDTLPGTTVTDTTTVTSPPPPPVTTICTVDTNGSTLACS